MKNNHKAILLITTISLGTSAFAGRISNPANGSINNPIGEVFDGLSGFISGGAIQNHGSISTITNSTFKGNSTFYWAGAISNSGGTIGEIVNSSFDGNSSEYGGAIENSNGHIGKIIHSDFIGNSGEYGGAIENSIGSIGEIVDCDFIGNSGEYGGAIYNAEGSVGISAKNDDVTFTGNGGSTCAGSLYNESGTFNLNAYSENKIIFNDGISGEVSTKNSNKITINSGLNGFGNSVTGVDGKSFGAVEFNNKVENNIVTVNNGTLKLGAYAKEDVSVKGDKKTFGPSIASLVNSELIVSDGAKLVVGTNDDKDSILIDKNSDITVNGTLEFEGNASIDIAGTFVANDATLSLEFSDYVSELAEGEKVTLNWVIANFENEDAAKDAINGFSNFENDLGIAKNDGLTDLWFDVKQDGSSIKVVGVIPEPATLGLISLIGTGFMLYRRRFC